MKPEFRNPDRSAIVVANFLGVHDEDRALKPAAGGRRRRRRGGGGFDDAQEVPQGPKAAFRPLACACQLAAAMQSQASLLA
jgi:hypothetical protein